MQGFEKYAVFGLIPVYVDSDTGVWVVGGPTSIERRINDAVLTGALTICRTFQWPVTLERVEDE